MQTYSLFLFRPPRCLGSFAINGISHFAFYGFRQKQNLLQPLLTPRSNAMAIESLARLIKKRIDKPILFFISPRRDSNAGKTRFRKPPLYPTELRGDNNLNFNTKLKSIKYIFYPCIYICVRRIFTKTVFCIKMFYRFFL